MAAGAGGLQIVCMHAGQLVVGRIHGVAAVAVRADRFVTDGGQVGLGIVLDGGAVEVGQVGLDDVIGDLVFGHQSRCLHGSGHSGPGFRGAKSGRFDGSRRQPGLRGSRCRSGRWCRRRGMPRRARIRPRPRTAPGMLLPTQSDQLPMRQGHMRSLGWWRSRKQIRILPRVRSTIFLTFAARGMHLV